MNCTLMYFYRFYLFGNANMIRIKRQLISTVIMNKIMVTGTRTSEGP